MKFRIKFFFENWKMIFHLFARTSYFGVNNELWVSYRSIFSCSLISKILNVRTNYKMMKIRTFIGFLPLNDAIKLFPGFSRKKNFKPIEIK